MTAPLALRRENWPRLDQLAWERAVAPDEDLLGESGQGADKAPATLASYEHAYGQYLAFLSRSGQLNETEEPAERVTRERVAAWRRDCKARGLVPTARRQMLTVLHATLKMMAPKADLKFIIRIGGLPLKKAIPGRPRERIARDTNDVMVHVRRLHQEGLADPSGFAGWWALRDAALLALLLNCAPRLGSLVWMTMDRHIRLDEQGIWHVDFPPEHVKTRRRLGNPLDAECSAMLSDYLRLARSRFPYADRSDHLWMGRKGPLGIEGLSRACEQRTLQWFGVAHGPHSMRRWLTVTAKRRSPELAFDAAELLGHDLEMGVQHYSEASGLHAALRHGDRLAARRARTAGLAERAYAEMEADDEKP